MQQRWHSHRTVNSTSVVRGSNSFNVHNHWAQLPVLTVRETHSTAILYGTHITIAVQTCYQRCCCDPQTNAGTDNNLLDTEVRLFCSMLDGITFIIIIIIITNEKRLKWCCCENAAGALYNIIRREKLVTVSQNYGRIEMSSAGVWMERGRKQLCLLLTCLQAWSSSGCFSHIEVSGLLLYVNSTAQKVLQAAVGLYQCRPQCFREWKELDISSTLINTTKYT